MLRHQLEQLFASYPHLTPYFWLAIVALGTIPGYLLGVALARGMKLQEYGGRLGFIAMTLTLSLTLLLVGTPKYGIDLRGGYILVYEIDVEASKDLQEGDTPAKIDEVVTELSTRLNPGGVNEILVRPYGDKEVEIIVPDVSDEEKDVIKRQVANAGVLEFMILATDREKDEVINVILNEPTKANATNIYRDNDPKKPIGLWARVNWDDAPTPLDPKAKEIAVFNPAGYFRDSTTGRLLLRDATTGDLLPIATRMDTAGFQAYLLQENVKHVDALMVIDPENRVKGVQNANPSINPSGDRIVEFRMNADGATRMGTLTSNNVNRPMGIVLDNVLRSAPNINEPIYGQGQISGRFSKSEVQFLTGILNAGKLSAQLNKTPISENQISPLLGEDTIRKGINSLIVAVIVVLAFLWLYYRYAGAVACIGLVANTLMVVAVMIVIKAAFTLPGLAGMVLSIGMSVDANVLVNERIREELARGAALRMAIRNGFNRAMSTIVDSNVTAVVTAIVLYVVGTEQLKGFAVTLILGIVMSMYTAVYIARIVLEISERKRFITTLTMMNPWGKPQFDFIKLYWPTTIASIVVIVIGMGVAIYRGADLFDIDFNGGTSIDMMLKEPMPIAEVRKRLNEDLPAALPALLDKDPANKDEDRNPDVTVTSINNVKNHENGTIYKVETSLTKLENLEAVLEKVFQGPKGERLLATNDVQTVSIVTDTTERKRLTPKLPATTKTDKTEKTDKADETKKAPVEGGNDNKSPADPEKKPDATEKKPDETKQPEPAPEKPAVKEEQPKGTEPAPEKKPEEQEKPAAPDKQVFRGDVPGDLLAQADPVDPAKKPEDDKKVDPAKPEDKKPAEAKPEDKKPEDKQPDETKPADPIKPSTEVTPPVPATQAAQVVTLKFANEINAKALYLLLTNEVQALAAAKKLEQPFWDDAERPQWIEDMSPTDSEKKTGFDVQTSSVRANEWSFVLLGSKADAETIAKAVEHRAENTTSWSSSSKIGGKVAGKTRNQALVAVLASMLGIVGYVWFRFHKIAFGVAAVVALVHDLFVTIGFLAISKWLAPYLGILLVEDFKISLTVIAAILTLIGYSLNDTIVTFDRIREIKGKSPNLTPDIINRSINETLGRTFLTGGLMLITTLILYVFGGAGIHGFAYAMLIGVIAGTYSSVFIAAPLLLWLAPSDTTPKQVVKAKVKA